MGPDPRLSSVREGDKDDEVLGDDDFPGSRLPLRCCGW